MTVRRYSISSNAIHVPCESVSSNKSRSDGEWARLRGGACGLSDTTTEDRDKADGKSANRRTLQHCVNKARCERRLTTVDGIQSCFQYNFVKKHLHTGT